MQKFLVTLLLTGITFTSIAQNITSGDAAVDTSRKTAEVKKLVSIGPGTMEFELSRGQSKSQYIYIINRKSKPYTFSVEMIDFTFDINNELKYIASHHNSCKDWVSFDKTLIEVGPESTGKILVTVSIPDNADADKEMKWVNIGVKTLQEEMNARDSARNLNVAITPAVGVGIQLFQIPPGAKKDMKMMSFEKINDSTCRMLCHNTGDTRVLASASIELSSTESDFKEIVRKEGMNILPGTKRNVDLVIPKTVPKGKYNVVAILDAGDDEVPLEAAQTTLEIN